LELEIIKDMKVTFSYDKQKDIWCLMNYGKGSMNSSTPTKVYEKLVALHGESPSEETASDFIDSYIKENSIDIEKYVLDYQNEWNQIADIYYKKAESIFGVNLENYITVYLTINNRCPYSIAESHFFVSVPTYSMRKTVMHELWHFYTWYKFGSQQEILGKQKYNEIKEVLTVLLNIEFKDLLGDIQDAGYPQHQELRTNILDIWGKDQDIEKLWNYIKN
jgi:hypothetical protein